MDQDPLLLPLFSVVRQGVNFSCPPQSLNRGDGGSKSDKRYLTGLKK